MLFDPVVYITGSRLQRRSWRVDDQEGQREQLEVVQALNTALQ